MVLTETTPLTRPAETPDVTLSRLRRLLDVSVALNALCDPARLLDFIVQTTTTVLDCEAASILLYDEAAGALRFEAASGDVADALRGTYVPLRGSLAGTTFSEDRILHAADAEADVRRYSETDHRTGFVTRALLCVPMRIDRQPVGVLQALNPAAGGFDRADAEALLIVASQAAVAIRNARHEAALQRANDRLGELDRLKTNFMSIASHELRTPITAIRGFGQILQEEVRGDLFTYADAVVRAGDRMMNVVETLDVMAGLQGELGVHPGTLVSLAAIAREVAAPEAVEVDLPDGPLLVDGDRGRLRLAVGNLVRNAVQFSAPGGVVRVEANVDGDIVHLRVVDAGRGIDIADLDRIFEAYVQVQDPDRRDHEGLGVGLTVARAVALQHRGRLWAESAGLGTGATFHLTLPLAEAGVQARPEAA